jgi:uncharacterized RDD family membrane protein YckC/predicted Ser/Thr protein kinase
VADPSKSNPAFEQTVLSSASVPLAEMGQSNLEGTRLRHFEVQRLLGRGGMGAVYLGRDTSLDRPVALKVLDAAIGRDKELRARFELEARAQARLRHPNVTQIYFIGEDRGFHFFAMEYVEGKPLDTALAKGEKIPWPRALEYIISAARGLREALSQGFIHRDVKPSNLLLDKDDTIKIADFGLAKSMKGDVELTREGVIVGSPLYMAPEQGRSETVDHRSDIYSLGCAFYHLLTGRPPFNAPTPVGVITKHVTDRPVPVRQIVSNVPAAVEAIVERMMAKDPNARFQTYDELLGALDAARPGRQSHSGFIARAIATVIDAAILAPTFIVLHSWAWLLVVAYSIVAHARFGQTIGKWFLKLKVVDAEGQKIGWKRAAIRFFAEMWAPVVWVGLGIGFYFQFQDAAQGFHMDLKRSEDFVAPLLYALAFTITLLAYVGGFLVAAFHPKKRALHDLLAGTYVTHKQRS